jgi:type III secretion protein L
VDNLLTLLEGGKVAPPLGKKILKKELTTTLLEGKNLITKIKEEGERYKIEATKQIETEREKALHEGFQEGYQKWLEHINKLEEEIQKVRSDMEKQIVPVALKAAQKVVSKEFEIHPDIIVDIVKNHLKAVAQHKKITIYVSKEDYDLLDKARDSLKEKLEHLEVFSVRFREDVKRGGVIIETEAGIINATIDNQWARIEKAFKVEGK